MPINPTTNLDTATKLLLHFNEDLTTDASGNYSNVENAIGTTLVARGKYKGAAHFDSTSQIVMTGNTTSVDLSEETDDWTIDFWLKFDTVPNNATTSYIVAMGSAQDDILFQFALRLKPLSDGMTVLFDNGDAKYSGSILNAEAITAGAGTWNHFAFVFDKTNSTLKFYYNGTLTTTITTDDVGLTNDEMFTEYSAATNVDHYLDEFRICNAQMFTEDFTPNAKEYGAYDRLNYRNTKVLMHFDTGLLKDECNNDWSLNGQASLADNGEEGSKSLKLSATEGTGVNYLQMQDSLAVGMNDFTIDFFVTADQDISAAAAGNPYLFELANSSNQQFLALKSTDGYSDETTSVEFKLQYRTNLLGAETNTSEDGLTLIRGTKSYIVVAYDAALHNITVYQDGSEVIVMDGVTFADTSDGILTIGNAPERGTANSKSFSGLIDEFRVTVGKDITTASFTTPVANYDINTEPLVTEDSDTIVFLSFDEYANKDDCGGYWKQIGGKMKLSSTKAKYGTSLLVENSLNYLKKKQNIDLHNTDFTIDLAIFDTGTSAAGQILFEIKEGSTNNMKLQYTTADTLTLDINDNTADIDLSSLRTTAMTNISIVFTKEAITTDNSSVPANTVIIFVNGTQVGTIDGVDLSAAFTNSDVYIANGASGTLATNYYGYLDKFRIVKAVAYTVSDDNNATGEGIKFTIQNYDPSKVIAVDGIRNSVREAIAAAVQIPLVIY